MLQSYNRVVQAMDSSSKKKNLCELNRFWTTLYPKLVADREVKSIELSELSNIMKWKLSRGKMRPLQKLVDSNDPNTVLRLSTQAFAAMDSSTNWLNAIKLLCELKGVGEATASAILAPLYPETCPFMSDEVIEATTTGGLKYDSKTYAAVRDALVSKAEALNHLQSVHVWTAEDVGKALWTRAKMTIFFPDEDSFGGVAASLTSAESTILAPVESKKRIATQMDGSKKKMK
jgi:hypothetical protein